MLGIGGLLSKIILKRGSLDSHKVMKPSIVAYCARKAVLSRRPLSREAAIALYLAG